MVQKNKNTWHEKLQFHPYNRAPSFPTSSKLKKNFQQKVEENSGNKTLPERGWRLVGDDDGALNDVQESAATNEHRHLD